LQDSQHQTLGILQGLTADERREVLREAQERDARAGATFFEQDERAGDLFVLVSGWVKLSRLTSDGRQIVVQLVGPGEVFGSVLDDGVHPEFAVAMVPSVALTWPAAALTRLV